MIYVCSLSRLAETVERSGARHVVTLINEGTPVERPAVVTLDNHLRIGINDIAEPMDGMVCPDESVVERLIAFGETWDEASPMIVHCWAGISRSTASAFTLACARSPEADEAQIAWTLRSLAPHAYPNRRIVALADDMLGRGGRMVDAITAIGGNGYVSLGAPFDFAARH